MLGLGFRREERRSPMAISLSSFVSFLIVVFSQMAMAVVPGLLPYSSVLELVPVAGLVLVGSVGLGRIGKEVVRVAASAPALVVFNVCFVWGFHVGVIRQAIPSLLDVTFSVECLLLLLGFCRIASCDPGLVALDSSSSVLHDGYGLSETNIQHENSPLFARIRYCNICKTGVREFDHHCPAFGNCIGQKNHSLFMVLLVGFVIAEVTYVMSSNKYITKYPGTRKVGLEGNLRDNFVISTMLFCILQLLWQVLFLIWHIYCICFNITTDEWINWKKYPEFQLVIPPQAESPFSETKFSNPYDKGIVENIRDFWKGSNILIQG